MNWSTMTAPGHCCSTCCYSMLANSETMDVANCCIECPLDGDMMMAASTKIAFIMLIYIRTERKELNLSA